MVCVGVFVAPAWAILQASFTYAPTQPFTGQTVTLTSTSTDATAITWDLDGDGECDDASGTTTTTSFESAGTYAVTVCAEGAVPIPSKQTRPITVRNRPPTASFTAVPEKPVATEEVVFTSTSFDPDGPIASQTWDFDHDGAFDDGSGDLVRHAFAKAGTYPVTLRVTDRDGAATVSTQNVVVARKPYDRFRREPFVRLISSPTSSGAHIDLLSVKASKGAKVNVRCRGRGCPFKSKSATSKGKTIDVRNMRRGFRAGVVIEVRVTKANTIGKFVRITVLDGRRPKRVDRCLTPGKSKPTTHC